jgi:hypothetical protein
MKGWNRAGMMLLAGLVAGCGATVAEPDAAPRQAVVLQKHEVVLVENWNSGFEAPERLFITDAGAWAAAWQLIHRHQSDVPPLPAVDFARDVVILAAMGPRPTGGFRVTVDAVHAHGGVLYATVIERSPGAGCGTFQAITSPVHAVRVPRDGTSARFVINRQTVNC